MSLWRWIRFIAWLPVPQQARRILAEMEHARKMRETLRTLEIR